MSKCSLGGSLPAPVAVRKGDLLQVRSYYNVDPTDQRSLPLPGGSHGGVMALFYVVVAQSSQPSKTGFVVLIFAAVVSNVCF